jgi:hypothetical protein
MRPTDLHYRSPKEKTAEFLYPQIMTDGRKIPLIKKNGTTKGSFSMSHRFPQYEEDEKKTGYRVGPGAYYLDQESIQKKFIRGTPQYHKSHVGKNWNNNGYIYVGQSVVFDPGLMNKSMNVLNDLVSTVDASQVIQKADSKVKSKRSVAESSEYFSSRKGKSSDHGFRLSDSFFRRSKNNPYFAHTMNSPKF